MRRLIPKLQLKSRMIGTSRRMVLVTTTRFGEVKEIGDPISQAKIYEDQAADELILIDLDATAESRLIMPELVERLSSEVCMPLTVGGGVKSIEDFRTLLLSGADKVAMNSAAFHTPELISEAAKSFGEQCVVVSIDYRRASDGTYQVWTNAGTHPTGLDPVSLALKCELAGAGEILLTSIDRDGTRQGLDIEMTRRVTQRLTIPVVTSGGCGLASHFVEGFLEGNADGVASGTYFCFKDENPMQCRSQIKNANIPIRLHVATMTQG